MNSRAKWGGGEAGGGEAGGGEVGGGELLVRWAAAGGEAGARRTAKRCGAAAPSTVRLGGGTRRYHWEVRAGSGQRDGGGNFLGAVLIWRCHQDFVLRDFKRACECLPSAATKQEEANRRRERREVRLRVGLRDEDAVKANIQTWTCEAPTTSRRGLARNAATEASFVAAGHVAKQVALLAAGSAEASDLETNTAPEYLAELAASALVPLTTYLIAPSPPPAPAPMRAVNSQGSNQEAEAALAMSIAFPLFAFFMLLFFVPLCTHRWTGGNIRSFLRLCTTHSNPNMIMRYLPADARERIRNQIAADRAAMGREINACEAGPIHGWIEMARAALNKTMDDDEAMERKASEARNTQSMNKLMADMDDGGDTLRPLGVPGATPLGLPPAQAGVYPSAKARAAAAAPEREEAYSEYSDTGGNAAMVDEPDQDRQRRIEWIKYYVRTGEPDKAYELGWDGLPFQIARSESHV